MKDKICITIFIVIALVYAYAIIFGGNNTRYDGNNPMIILDQQYENNSWDSTP